MRQRLAAPEESGKPIRISIIGCGRFGSMMVAQIKQEKKNKDDVEKS